MNPPGPHGSDSEADIRSVQTNPSIGERGIIDIHLPPGGGGDWPFVLAVHGGAWRNGDRHAYAWLVRRLLPRGFAVVTCSYRLSAEAFFPAPYDDLLHLMAWLRRHAGEQGLHARSCSLLGSSAGGHLVCLLATRGLRDHGDAIIPVACVVAYCPPTDLAMQYLFDRSRGVDMTERLMGGTPDALPEPYRLASPIHHIHPGMPPLWLAHGDADAVVPFPGSVAFVEKLHEHGLEPAFHIARGRGHTMTQRDDGDPVLLEKEAVVQFLRGACKTSG